MMDLEQAGLWKPPPKSEASAVNDDLTALDTSHQTSGYSHALCGPDTSRCSPRLRRQVFVIWRRC